MEQKQFELALQFCGDNSNQRSQVMLQQAHHCLNKHQYDIIIVFALLMITKY